MAAALAGSRLAHGSQGTVLRPTFGRNLVTSGRSSRDLATPTARHPTGTAPRASASGLDPCRYQGIVLRRGRPSRAEAASSASGGRYPLGRTIDGWLLPT